MDAALCHNRPMWRVLAALTGAALLLTGCARYLDGDADVGARTVDPAAFFDGTVPTYGRQVSVSDKLRLSYLRALRRIDVCGLSDRENLSRIGEIQSMGTLFALEECDVTVKVPGRAASKYVSTTVELVHAAGRPDGLGVRGPLQGACEFLVPLGLSELPGAGPLFGPEQPHVRIGMVAEFDCAEVRRFATAIASGLARTPLPLRDGLAVYTTPLAERDPCEVLGTFGDDEIGYWNIPAGGPYRCEFGLTGDGGEPVSMSLTLRPRVVDIEGRELVRTGDAEVYLDRRSCTALVFVGPDMQRRVGNGDLVATGDVRIRPAVDVDSGEADCTGTTLAGQLAARAAALYR